MPRSIETLIGALTLAMIRLHLV